MTRRAWVGAAVLLVVAAGGWALLRRDTPRPALALLNVFESAEKRPAPDLFSVKGVTINGERRMAISAPPASRVIFHVVIPHNAWLRTLIALEPEAWEEEGDGVLFRIGVADGTGYQELFSQHVNPYSVEGDRRWLPVSIDLTGLGGRTVDLIFNTNSSLPGGGDNRQGDRPVWGEPYLHLK